MERCIIFFLVTCIILLLFTTSNGDTIRKNGADPWIGNCSGEKFLCFNGRCIDRSLYCNGRHDCGDGSDENYCNNYPECPTKRAMRKCPGTQRCIMEEWFCDGIRDCHDGQDEERCGSSVKNKGPLQVEPLQSQGTELLQGLSGPGAAPVAKMRALRWLHKQKEFKPPTEKWGSFVDKSAAALYLASNSSANETKEDMNEMAYEVSIQLLSRLSTRKLQDIPSSKLASYVNAFLVTCLNPRNFHGVNIIVELRSRVNRQNFTNPYVLLSLCNAGETITESDKSKLIDAFWSKQRRVFWTDIQAVVVMALACANRQSGNRVDTEKMRELTSELKRHQYKNGTVENLQTTALVMQALLSVEPDVYPDNFDEAKALKQMIAMQKEDGSFRSFMNTYYVLPVLNRKSLVNINTDHCEPSGKDEISALDDLISRGGPKIHVRYSIWIGNERDLERHLTLYVPTNISFYGIMKRAGEIDCRYRFEYVVKNRKPYVTALSGLQDDPESGKFWFLYTLQEGNPNPSQESPADITPQVNDHFAMWYRRDSWIDV